MVTDSDAFFQHFNVLGIALSLLAVLNASNAGSRISRSRATKLMREKQTDSEQNHKNKNNRAAVKQRIRAQVAFEGQAPVASTTCYGPKHTNRGKIHNKTWWPLNMTWLKLSNAWMMVYLLAQRSSRHTKKRETHTKISFEAIERMRLSGITWSINDLELWTLAFIPVSACVSGFFRTT